MLKYGFANETVKSVSWQCSGGLAVQDDENVEDFESFRNSMLFTSHQFNLWTGRRGRWLWLPPPSPRPSPCHSKERTAGFDKTGAHSVLEDGSFLFLSSCAVIFADQSSHCDINILLSDPWKEVKMDKLWLQCQSIHRILPLYRSHSGPKKTGINTFGISVYFHFNPVIWFNLISFLSLEQQYKCIFILWWTAGRILTPTLSIVKIENMTFSSSDVCDYVTTHKRTLNKSHLYWFQIANFLLATNWNYNINHSITIKIYHVQVKLSIWPSRSNLTWMYLVILYIHVVN